jgi:hypothetical protein
MVGLAIAVMGVLALASLGMALDTLRQSIARKNSSDRPLGASVVSGGEILIRYIPPGGVETQERVLVSDQVLKQILSQLKTEPSPEPKSTQPAS